MLPPTSLDATETAHVAASLILCDAIDREARESSTEPIPEDELSSRRLALVLAGRSRDATNIGHLTNERNVARARAEQLETDVATLRAEVEDLTRKLDTATLEAETLESSEYGVAVRALMDRAADLDLPATAQGLSFARAGAYAPPGEAGDSRSGTRTAGTTSTATTGRCNAIGSYTTGYASADFRRGV